MKKETEIKKEDKIEISFSKEQILSSKAYSDKKDLVTTLLDESKSYSFEEVDIIIDKFMKEEVK